MQQSRRYLAAAWCKGEAFCTSQCQPPSDWTANSPLRTNTQGAIDKEGMTKGSKLAGGSAWLQSELPTFKPGGKTLPAMSLSSDARPLLAAFGISLNVTITEGAETKYMMMMVMALVKNDCKWRSTQKTMNTETITSCTHKSFHLTKSCVRSVADDGRREGSFARQACKYRVSVYHYVLSIKHSPGPSITSQSRCGDRSIPM